MTTSLFSRGRLYCLAFTLSLIVPLLITPMSRAADANSRTCGEPVVSVANQGTGWIVGFIYVYDSLLVDIRTSWYVRSYVEIINTERGRSYSIKLPGGVRIGRGPAYTYTQPARPGAGWVKTVWHLNYGDGAMCKMVIERSLRVTDCHPKCPSSEAVPKSNSSVVMSPFGRLSVEIISTDI